MDVAEAFAFIGRSKQAVMITHRKEGGLQTSVVTAVTGPDGEVWVWSRGGTAKGYNLRRDPRASLCVLAEGLRGWLHLDLTARVVDQPEALPLLDEYYRYRHGHEHENWEEYRQEMLRDRRQLFLMTPTRAFKPAR